MGELSGKSRSRAEASAGEYKKLAVFPSFRKERGGGRIQTDNGKRPEQSSRNNIDCSPRRGKVRVRQWGEVGINDPLAAFWPSDAKNRISHKRPEPGRRKGYPKTSPTRFLAPSASAARTSAIERSPKKKAGKVSGCRRQKFKKQKNPKKAMTDVTSSEPGNGDEKEEGPFQRTGLKILHEPAGWKVRTRWGGGEEGKQESPSLTWLWGTERTGGRRLSKSRIEDSWMITSPEEGGSVRKGR